jgi:hypothetical protein
MIPANAQKKGGTFAPSKNLVLFHMPPAIFIKWKIEFT